jgi:soluble lytic murein transglycosylase-like protein
MGVEMADYTQALADGFVDIDKVFQIESNNNPKAYNKKSGAIGLGQIVDIALKDYNIMNPQEKYSKEQLLDPQINAKVSNWMLSERIPQMLKHFNLPITTENVLWAYNAGIGNVVKGIKPKETVKYIEKYNALGKE